MERNPVQAKRIIEEEHRSLAAVLHGMLYVVREIRYVGIKPDFVLLEAMVHYIDVFQERFHHPQGRCLFVQAARVSLPRRSAVA